MGLSQRQGQLLTQLVRFAQRGVVVGHFSDPIEIFAAKHQVAFVHYLDPFEEAGDAPSGTLEPSLLSPDQNHRAGAFPFDSLNEMMVRDLVAKVSRSQTIAAIDKRLGLSRNGVEIDR
jgi:hypothetical protein